MRREAPAVRRRRRRRPGAGGRGASRARPAVAALGKGLDGLSIVKPPYGVMAAIDLKNGTLMWQVPHGDTPDVGPQPPAAQGPEHSEDRPGRQRRRAGHQDAGHRRRPAGHDAGRRRGAMLRAYDKKTGAQVGEVRMPAPISGSPMTYSARRPSVHHRRGQRRQLHRRVHRVRGAADPAASDDRRPAITFDKLKRAGVFAPALFLVHLFPNP